MSRIRPEQIELASLTDVGRTRTENQDAFGAFRRADGARLMIVADGMGGHRGGATASRMCIEAVGRVFGEEGIKPEDALVRGMHTANDEVRQAAARDPELEGMGTTAVAIMVDPEGEAVVGWVGDSRAYLMRDGELRAITEDHSLVALWVKEGVLTPEQAEDHPRRNELLRAIGVMDEIEVESSPIELLAGDRLVLCSDGLCGVVPEATIRSVLGSDPPEEAAKQLVASANAAGGPDNVTVQVLAVNEVPSGGRSAPASSSSRSILGLVLAITLLAAVIGGLALSGVLVLD